MTPIRLNYHARNGLIFFRDERMTATPEIWNPDGVWRNETCLAAGCLPDSEGPTMIVVADAAEAPKTNHLLFDGEIDFPSGFAVIDTVLDDVICEFPVAPGRHRVRLWTDGHKCTEILVFGLD
ncbi:MAG: hypothetical protein IPL47_01875 [Phyllobacteriaceae bacterium]|nr:hypothetical protein [Phyllobacteriaceae bacterium]